MPRTPALSKSDLRRLERLARQAGTAPARVLKAVLRDGFEYTEWFVRQVKEGEADLKAGRVFSTTDLLTRSRANLRRLRTADTEIAGEIARRGTERYTAKRVREFDRAEAPLAGALRELTRRARAARGFLKNADRVAAAGVPALSESAIQAEIEALRRVRKQPRRGRR